ncbi:unnamed protein product [Didymodactylos carnosus]|uniref:Uncharacterized protein n=1 Tax=Didymodactylos carnosus TaxID=1234261 RepID=A0A8S2IEA1_9BILA|nr:unnamed protein product [Didymodactylos carnosus]CAF3738023.1 unnamed protein product [Didymodactylos carnosus]
MNARDEKELNTCLNSIIRQVDEVLEKLKNKQKRPPTSTSQPETGDAPLFNNSVQNNNVNTFTLDNDETDLLDTLTSDVQNILRTSLPLLSNFCSTYIEEYLHQHHFSREQAVFTEGLTANILYTFQHDLHGLLMAAKAYPAALRGELKIVKEFLKRFPNYKDKAGYWGTTLLYSAARNNHMPIVKYLIESIGCSVNAQNTEDINFALSIDNASTTSGSFRPDPKAASTALHAACYNNNLDIVKYLIDKGANYFVLNQLGETPIQNAQHNQEIESFFRNYLILTYTTLPNAPLPNATILGSQNRAVNDCIWEYKLVSEDVAWKEFTQSEHDTLSTSLRPTTDRQKQFSNTIYLSVQQGTYSVQLLTFLRGGRNQDPNPMSRDRLAWIRCRGSSIANFDIHCTWQMMLVQHNRINAETTKPPSLEALAIPVTYDSKFQLQLHNWYTCDTTVTDILDHTMNYRRKCVDIDCKYIGTVTANLHTFTFFNNEKTILGFIRWIPKFISNIHVFIQSFNIWIFNLFDGYHV